MPALLELDGVRAGYGDAVVLEVGTRSSDDTTTYPDIDMLYVPRKGYVRRDGTRYRKG